MTTANERRLVIWNRLTPEQRDYDRFVARSIPFGADHRPETAGGREMYAAMTDPDDRERGCSCHISPPCSYCTSLLLCDLCEFETFVHEDDMADHIAEEHPDAPLATLNQPEGN